MQIDDYVRHFTDASFWRTVGRAAGRAARSVVEESITLYHCLRDPDTPAWARAVIVGTLGYFVLPTDLVPDFIPVIGFSDDLGAFVAAGAIVAVYVKDEHRSRAQQLVAAWADA